MSDSEQLKPIFERSPALRWLGWVLSSRNLRRLAVGVLCLAALIVLFYSEENWRGARAELAYRRTLEAKGRILDYTRFVPASVPDNQNFANTAFFAPLFDFKPGTQTARDTNAWKRTVDFAKDFPAGALKDGWQMGIRIDLAACATGLEKSQSSGAERINLPTNAMSRTQAAAAILDGLKKYDVVLDELRAAARRPHCRFNIYYELDNPSAILFPHLATIKRICQILELRALAELELGNTQSAAEDIVLLLYLADSLSSEPLLISQLVRIACLRLGVQAIWEGMHSWPDSKLSEWQVQLRQLDFMKALAFSIGAERVWGDRIIDWVKNNRGGGHDFSALTSMVGDSYPFSRVLQFCPKGWFDLEKLNYNRIIEESVLPCFSEAPRRIYPAVVARNSEFLDRSLNVSSGMLIRHTVFSGLLLFPIESLQRKFALAQTTVDQALVACGLERYRLANDRYPEKLGELVPSFLDEIPSDIVSGAPLTFRQEGSHLFLYSVGWNEKDDGGTVVLTKEKSPVVDFSQGDWVWQSPEK